MLGLMVAIAGINSGVLAIKTSPLSCLIFSIIEGKLSLYGDLRNVKNVCFFLQKCGFCANFAPTIDH